MINRLFEIYQMSYNTYFTTLHYLKAGHINIWPDHLNNSLPPLYFSKIGERIIESKNPEALLENYLKIPVKYLYKHTSNHVKTRLRAKFEAVKSPHKSTRMPNIRPSQSVQPRNSSLFIIHPYKSLFTPINSDFTAHFTGSSQIYLTFPSFYFPIRYFSLFQPRPTYPSNTLKPLKNKNRTKGGRELENYFSPVISSIPSLLPLHLYIQIR